jgi:signal transduction histidine kinase
MLIFTMISDKVEFGPAKGQGIDPVLLDNVLLETERLAGIGLLTASVVHELNNPISVITTTSENMLNHLETGPIARHELRQYLKLIDDSAWRCARLVQMLRNYSRSNGPEYAPCRLNQIVNDALTLVSYHFERHHDINIETDLDRDLKTVSWDQNQVTQILINLLTNARDALAGKGGLIRIRTWQVPAESAQAFSVSDNGPGIEMPDRERIFEPFFTTKPPGQGTGLGLAIVARIVAQHRGRVSAVCHGDGGVTFTVVLPCRP